VPIVVLDFGHFGDFGLDPEIDEPEDEIGHTPSQRPAPPSEATKSMMSAAVKEAEDAEKKQRREDKQRHAQLAERRRAVKQFLRKNGFAGVNDPKRVCLLWRSYPLHAAVEKNNLRVVEMLLAEGADASRTNSSGHTAADVAQKKNKKGSHATMLHVLESAGGGTAAAKALGGA